MNGVTAKKEGEKKKTLEEQGCQNEKPPSSGKRRGEMCVCFRGE